MRRLFLGGLALAALLLPCAASAKIVSNFGITIASCVVNSNGNQTNGINIVYYNTHPSPATEVDFKVRYHKQTFILTDRGSFSQGAEINHNLTNALVGEVWEGPEPKLCTVTRVLLANGKEFE
jgi:prephenate dehydratase